MNILKVLENKYYKLAFECGLQLCKIKDGRPVWIGDSVSFSNYWHALEQNNLC